MNNQNFLEKNRILYHAGLFLLVGFFILKLAKVFMKDRIKNFSLSNYIFSGFFILFGIFIIIAVKGQYDYFVTDKKYLFFKRILDETGVKIFYYLLGLFFMWLGYMFLR